MTGVRGDVASSVPKKEGGANIQVVSPTVSAGSASPSVSAGSASPACSIGLLEGGGHGVATSPRALDRQNISPRPPSPPPCATAQEASPRGAQHAAQRGSQPQAARQWPPPTSRKPHVAVRAGSGSRRPPPGAQRGPAGSPGKAAPGGSRADARPPSGQAGRAPPLADRPDAGPPHWEAPPAGGSDELAASQAFRDDAPVVPSPMAAAAASERRAAAEACAATPQRGRTAGAPAGALEAYPPSPPSASGEAAEPGHERPAERPTAQPRRLEQVLDADEAAQRSLRGAAGEPGRAAGEGAPARGPKEGSMEGRPCGDHNAAAVFERAEALCEAQRYEEAAALFRRVIAEY